MNSLTLVCTISCVICIAYSIPVPVHPPAASYRLDDVSSNLLFKFISSLYDGKYPSYQLNSSAECDACKKIVGSIITDAASKKVFDEVLRGIGTQFCIEILDIRKYDGKAMCPNIIELYGPIIWYSIVNSELSAEKICQLLFICPKQERNVSCIPQTPLRPASLLKEPTSVHLSDPDSTDTVIRFVHISDVHLDPHFKEGAPSTCNFLLCCHESMTGTNPAGMYGAYGCDLPVTTANFVLHHLATLQDIDFVLYGGDNPPHDVWIETEQSQMDIETTVVNMFKKNFPNTPVYPVLGNHESYPESEYLQDFYTNLTETLSRLWSSLAPFPASALKSIGYGGYYTLMLKPKLRLIAYNSDYGYIFNFYTLLNHKNHAFVEHTKWLRDTLAQAKKNGEKVLLAAHVPPGITSTSEEYGKWFTDITVPYSDIIVGQLFGHTHQDHFKVVQHNGKAISSVLISPSVTTFVHQNPSYRIYSMNSTTFEIIDYEQYFLNLTKANSLAKQGKTPQFELNYSAKKLYGMKDLSPDSWLDLANRFKTNSTLLLQYVDNMFARSKVPSCSTECKKVTICECENSDPYEAMICSL